METEARKQIVEVDKKAQAAAPSDVIEVTIETDVSTFVVKLSKTYMMNDKAISEVDLSGLEDINGYNLEKAYKAMQKAGSVSAVKELDPAYQISVASDVTGYLPEFFKALRAADYNAVLGRVQAFLLGVG